MRRDYGGAADLASIQRFCQRIWSMNSRFHVGDLGWSLGQTPDGRPEWRMSVWESGGVLEAWGWLTGPDDLSLLVDPARPELVDEVLDWAGPAAAVTVLDGERHLVAALERRGYTPDRSGPYFLALSRGLADLPPVPALPRGWTVRPTTDADLARRAAVHREVWHPSAVTEERYRRLAAGWPYRPEFDIVVEAPDGQFAAYCLGWYDEVNRSGEFEPVGTLAGYRRRGDDGYPVPRQVYAALGFTPHGRTVVYRP